MEEESSSALELDPTNTTEIQEVPSSSAIPSAENGDTAEEEEQSHEFINDYDEEMMEETGFDYDEDEEQNPYAETDMAPPNTANEDQGESFYPDTGWEQPLFYEQEISQNPVVEHEGEHEGEDAFYVPSVPKMKSRFSMSNQQILDLNDPFNQKAFEGNITRLDHLTENTQKDYCSVNFNLLNPEDNEFRLSEQLLLRLIHKDELDLAGNFLQQNVGRRLNDDDMPELVDFLSRDQQVTRLNLAYNNFGDDAATNLFGVLLVRPDIIHLNMAQNDFAEDASCQLFDILMQRPPLHSLKLTGIKIGDEGFKWLICLVLSGRGPYNLDVSETDMTMANFQGLCTAWQCLDRDEVFPKFLVDNPLPIPLEILAQMKVANNELSQQEYEISQRRSITDLIRMDAGDMENTQEIPKEPVDYQYQSQLLEKVSATILEGLFEIPQLKQFPETGDGPEIPSTLERGQKKINKIVKKAAKFPQDAGNMIEEYKKIKDAGCIPFEPDGRPVIVCPSLYSLDMDDFYENESLADGGKFIPSPLDELVQQAQEAGKAELKSGRAADDDTANTAADTVMTRVLAEAATFAARTEYGEKADASQILLASVLSTCQRAIELRGPDGEFRDEDLAEIWDVSTKETVRLIYNRIPPERCSLTPHELVPFVRRFMETSNRTLLRLLQNPFIPPFIFNVGSLLCKDGSEDENNEEEDEEDKEEEEDEEEEEEEEEEQEEDEQAVTFDPQLLDSTDAKNVQKIVMSFLEGAVTAAATIIGSGDPFYFRSNEIERGGPLKDALERSKIDTEATEDRVGDVVKDFIHAGAALGAGATDLNKKLEVTLDTMIDPAIEFLCEAFDQTAHLLIDLEKRRKDLEEVDNRPFVQYPFASRPTRLVLNRPLFQDFEPVMSAKVGDFLRMNTSVKCLHMRKWNLMEDGMISLMDSLSLNTNIVLLDLGCNSIGSEGVRGLVKFIQKNPNLKHLLLNHNGLRNPGLKYLTPAFPGSSVEFLNISYNGIGDSLEAFLDIVPSTRIKSLYVLGNSFNQASWEKLKYLYDTERLLPQFCDVLLQDVDGEGIVVKNSQVRDTNEWYDVHPIVPMGLYRAPYFEEMEQITP